MPGQNAGNPASEDSPACQESHKMLVRFTRELYPFIDTISRNLHGLESILKKDGESAGNAEAMKRVADSLETADKLWKWLEEHVFVRSIL